MEDERSTTPEIPRENQEPFYPLPPNDLGLLSSLLNEIREELVTGRHISEDARSDFIARLDKLISHRSYLKHLAYRKWLLSPEEFDDIYLPFFMHEDDPTEMKLSIELILSCNAYAKAAMDAQQFHRYRSIWEEVKRIDNENRSIADEAKPIYERFCEVFRGHNYLMQRLALIKWLNPHNIQKSPVRNDVKTSARHLMRL